MTKDEEWEQRIYGLCQLLRELRANMDGFRPDSSLHRAYYKAWGLLEQACDSYAAEGAAADE